MFDILFFCPLMCLIKSYEDIIFDKLFAYAKIAYSFNLSSPERPSAR